MTTSAKWAWGVLIFFFVCLYVYGKIPVETWLKILSGG